MTGIIIKAQSRKTIRFLRAESLVFIRFFKFIPHSPYSLNQFPVRSDVLPQGLDVRVHRAGIPAVPVSPHSFQQLVAAQDDVLVLRQLVQQVKVLGWQSDLFFV